jgi:UDP-3-O-acyl-N-acetylglucosamine deacetylase
VTLVEHVLGTLSGLRIDNCYVEVNGAEPPGLDGSARQFVEAVRQAGIVAQSAQRTVWAPTASIRIREGRTTLCLHPPRADELRISYFLDYGAYSVITPQRHSQNVTPTSFVKEIASSRTYLLEHEAAELQRQGIGKRTRITDLVVFGARGPMDNKLRHADEPARHKILDILGDLYLSGLDIRGHIVALRSGHPANVELVRQILARLGTTQEQGKRAA